jgi:hypothetical protein
LSGLASGLLAGNEAVSDVMLSAGLVLVPVVQSVGQLSKNGNIRAK